MARPPGGREDPTQSSGERGGQVHDVCGELPECPLHAVHGGGQLQPHEVPPGRHGHRYFRVQWRYFECAKNKLKAVVLKEPAI